MRAVAAPGHGASHHGASHHGASHHGGSRWAWGLSGLVAAAALAIPGARLITLAGVNGSGDPFAHPQHVTIRTVSVPQPVTSLTVQDYGGQVRVTAGPVRQAQVTEMIRYDSRAGVPAVAESVAGGRLNLSDPACQNTDCDVDFTVTVPSGITVSVDTQGGPADISGMAGGSVNTDGGFARIAQVTGSLTVSTGGGQALLSGAAGPLRIDTSGGGLVARGISAATASVSTGGGPAQVTFSAAPKTVTVNSDGGPAILRLPGGPYALTADSAGGPELIGIATDPAARATLTISSGGGPLQIEPASGAK
jgi:hypothetical protein